MGCRATGAHAGDRPQGVEQVVAGYNMAFELDRGYRTLHHGEELMPAALGLIAARTIQPGVIHDEDGLTITAFEVDHSPIKPALAIASIIWAVPWW